MTTELFADIGDTVYFLDEETKLIYPMVVHKIQKSRATGFNMILVSTDDGWDTRFAEVVSLSDYKKTWFTTIYDAEQKYQSDQTKQAAQKNIALLELVFKQLQRTKCYLVNSNTLVKATEYTYSNNSMTFIEDNGTTHTIPLNEIKDKIIMQ